MGRLTLVVCKHTSTNTKHKDAFSFLFLLLVISLNPLTAFLLHSTSTPKYDCPTSISQHDHHQYSQRGMSLLMPGRPQLWLPAITTDTLSIRPGTLRTRLMLLLMIFSCAVRHSCPWRIPLQPQECCRSVIGWKASGILFPPPLLFSNKLSFVNCLVSSELFRLPTVKTHFLS